MIAKCLKTSGPVTQRIERGLYYIVDKGDDVEAMFRGIPRDGRWCVNFVNMEKKLKEAYFPFTLSIHCPEALFEFYAGKLLIMVLVDLDFIKNTLSQRGIQVEFLDDDIWFMKTTHSAEEIRHGAMSRHFFGRIMSEFLNLDWFIEEASSRLNMSDELKKVIAQGPEVKSEWKTKLKMLDSETS